jgi:hypothetical protein
MLVCISSHAIEQLMSLSNRLTNKTRASSIHGITEGVHPCSIYSPIYSKSYLFYKTLNNVSNEVSFVLVYYYSVLYHYLSIVSNLGMNLPVSLSV